MEINNLFFNQLKFSSNSLKQNVSNVSIQNTDVKTSFNSHYENYKNDYDSKNTTTDKTSADNTKKSTPLKNNDMKKAKINSNSNDTNEKTQSVEEVEEEFVEKLAEKLNVSVDEIKSLLNELNMTVFDLLDTNNFNTFMQKFLDVQNPVDILASEQTQDLYKQAADVVQNYKQVYNELQNNIKLVKQSSDLQALDNVNNVNNEMAEVSKSTEINNVNNLNENQEISEEAMDKNKKNDSPIVEIKNTNKQNNDQSNGNYSKEQNPNETLLTQNTNQNFNYTPVYNYQQFQQQTVVDNIVANVSNASSTKDVHQIINQIVEKIKVDIKPDVSEMKLLLKPDTLGELSLKITTQNNIVTAQFVAESQQVKEVLQANFNNLKDTLQQLGLVIDEISVSVGQQDSQPRQQFAQNQQKSRHRMTQIINNMNTESTDTLDSSNHINPYNLKDTQVDYMA